MSVALVTGGGRGIGANVARALAGEGWQVAVGARTVSQVEETAAAVGGLALALDVTQPDSVGAAVDRTESELGPIDLLVCNAGIAGPDEPVSAHGVEEWWRTFEVNVLGVYLCCRAVTPRMAARGRGRVVNVSSGSAYLPGAGGSTAYGPSKAAVHRFSELLAAQLAPQNVFVFSISPGLVRTSMTDSFGDDAPWTPPECAPQLVLALASGEFDELAGRYLHAEHDPPERLRGRIAEIRDGDLNAIRLRR